MSTYVALYLHSCYIDLHKDTFCLPPCCPIRFLQPVESHPMLVLISFAIAGKVLGSVLRTEAYSPVEQMAAYTQQAGSTPLQTTRSFGFDLSNSNPRSMQHSIPEPC